MTTETNKEKFDRLMAGERTDTEVFDRTGVKVQMGGSELELRPIPAIYSREWRREASGILDYLASLESKAIFKNNEVSIANLDVKAVMQVARFFSVDLLDEVQRLVVLWLKLQHTSAPDFVPVQASTLVPKKGWQFWKKPAVASKPNALEILTQALPNNIVSNVLQGTDEECLQALGTVLRFAFPFAQTALVSGLGNVLSTMLKQSPSTTPTT